MVSSLQECGIPAGPVMTEQQLLEDCHLIDREWFQVRSHPAVGTHRYPGHPWRACGFDSRYGRPVPSFGEDNEYVYQKLLGYSNEEYDSLVAAGVISDRQLV